MSAALDSLGWDTWFAERWHALGSPGHPARVARLDRGWSTLWSAGGSDRARNVGADVAVGDWVVPSADGERIEHVLERRGAFVRRAARGATNGQVVVANADIAFLLHALTALPNRRRLERELVLAYESGATPAVVLTKADLGEANVCAVEEVRAVAPDVAVHVVSARSGAGLGELATYLINHRTVALLGASGVGKSTLVNRLVGDDRQRTGDVRADLKGRHTTTAAQLVRAGGGLLVDTPGLRSLGLWTAGEGLDRAFSDIAGLAVGCRFSNCRHDTEPGCAVRGIVEPARLDAYRRLRAELDAVEEALSRQRSG